MKPVEYLTDPDNWFISDSFDGPFYWWKGHPGAWQIVSDTGRVVAEGTTPQECLKQLYSESPDGTETS